VSARTWSASFALAVALFGGQSRAAATPTAEKRVAILTGITAADEITPVAVISDVKEVIHTRLGVRPAEGETTTRAIESLRACGSELPCLAEQVRSARAQLGFVVLISGALRPAAVSMRLIDDQGRELGNEVREAELEPRAISTAIRAMAARLLASAGSPPAARLTLDVQPAGAVVEIDGSAELSPENPSGNVYKVAPGRHQLRIRLDGYRDEERVLDLSTSLNEASISVELKKDSGLLGSFWFWGAVGLVIAGGVAGGFAIANQSPSCICVQPAGGGGPPCDTRPCFH
jgi:hypothetical protein